MPQASWIKKLDSIGCGAYNCGKPIADYHANISGKTVLFSDQSYAPSSWKWYLGDQTTFLDQNPPVKVYDDFGTYQVTLIIENDFGSDTVSRLIHLVPLSIDNIEKESISIYPNPVRELLYVKSGGFVLDEFIIKNMNDQIVESGNFNQLESNNTYQINVNGLAPGIYYLQCKSLNNILKFVKI